MRALLLALGLVFLGAAPASAQATPSKCNAAKLKATGAYAQAILGCQAKAVQKGASLDRACIEKARAKLEKAFEKGERKGDCGGSAAAPTARDQADGFRIDVGGVLLPSQICCGELGTGDDLCGWAEDASTCFKLGGIAGAEGSSCDSTGACVAGAPSSGPCCDNAGACFGGPITPAECTTGFVESGICLAFGECLPH
jgi:hypothetical protein